MYKDKVVYTYTHYILYTKCLVTQSEDLEKDQELSQRCIWKSQICSLQSCTSRSVQRREEDHRRRHRRRRRPREGLKKSVACTVDVAGGGVAAAAGGAA